jgi:hypothetical protein
MNDIPSAYSTPASVRFFATDGLERFARVLAVSRSRNLAGASRVDRSVAAKLKPPSDFFEFKQALDSAPQYL